MIPVWNIEKLSHVEGLTVRLEGFCFNYTFRVHFIFADGEEEFLDFSSESTYDAFVDELRLRKFKIIERATC